MAGSNRDVDRRHSFSRSNPADMKRRVIELTASGIRHAPAWPLLLFYLAGFRASRALIQPDHVLVAISNQQVCSH